MHSHGREAQEDLLSGSIDNCTPFVSANPNSQEMALISNGFRVASLHMS